MGRETIFTPLAAGWMVCCLAAWIAQAQLKPEAKPRWRVRLIFGCAALFLAIVWLCFPLPALVGAIPGTALTAYLILKSSRTCPHCGQRVARAPGPAALNYCAKCGARVHER